MPPPNRLGTNQRRSFPPTLLFGELFVGKFNYLQHSTPPHPPARPGIARKRKACFHPVAVDFVLDLCARNPALIPQFVFYLSAGCRPFSFLLHFSLGRNKPVPGETVGCPPRAHFLTLLGVTPASSSLFCRLTRLPFPLPCCH